MKQTPPKVDVASVIGVGESTVRNWEKGRTIPTLSIYQTERQLEMCPGAIAKSSNTFQYVCCEKCRPGSTTVVVKNPITGALRMAYVHEIKFYFCSNGTLKVALYDNPPLFSNEFWIKNIDASEMGFTSVPDGLKLEQKYKVEVLGIKPFHASKSEFDFINQCAETAKHIAGASSYTKTLTEAQCAKRVPQAASRSSLNTFQYVCRATYRR